MKKKWLLIFLLCAALAVATEAKNQCGGFKELTNIVGGNCDPGEGAACRNGIYQCYGKNDLKCVAVCQTVTRDLVEKVECGDGGYPNKDLTQCICRPGFKGVLCDTLDPCFRVNCGKNGVCNDEGKCRCDAGFSGERCEINAICDPNGIWNPKTSSCKCNKGFVGEYCTACSNVTLCVPNKRGEVDEKTYSLGVYTDELRSAMLTKSLPPDYTYGPVIPGTEALTCDCKIADSLSLEGQFFDWGRMAPDEDEDRHRCRRNEDDDDWESVGFQQDFMDHHFEERGRHDHVYWAGGAAWVIIFIILVFGCLCWYPAFADGNVNYSSRPVYDIPVNSRPNINVSNNSSYSSDTNVNAPKSTRLRIPE
jgi:hypothetical protein